MNKKTLLLLATTTAILTMGAGCATKPATNILPYNGAPGSSDPIGTEVTDGKYENSKYGFSLNFPETWKGYTAEERVLVTPLNGGVSDTSASIDFGYPPQKSLFVISMHTKDQWKEVQSQEGPVPGYLGENSQFVFGYSGAQDAANDTIRERMKEVDDIMKTFKITDNIKTTQTDMTGFKPVITYPLDGAVIKEQVVKIKGTAKPNSYLWAFIVNGNARERNCLSTKSFNGDGQTDSNGNFEFILSAPCAGQINLFIASEDPGLGDPVIGNPQWIGMCRNDSDPVNFTIIRELPETCKQ